MKLNNGKSVQRVVKAKSYQKSVSSERKEMKPVNEIALKNSGQTLKQKQSKSKPKAKKWDSLKSIRYW